MDHWGGEIELPLSWKPAGMVVEGRPGENFGRGEAWTGRVAWPSGAEFSGQMRGLRPVSGIEIDNAGKQWNIVFGRNSGTLGEELLPAMRRVILGTIIQLCK